MSSPASHQRLARAAARARFAADGTGAGLMGDGVASGCDASAGAGGAAAAGPAGAAGAGGADAGGLGGAAGAGDADATGRSGATVTRVDASAGSRGADRGAANPGLAAGSGMVGESSSSVSGSGSGGSRMSRGAAWMALVPGARLGSCPPGSVADGTDAGAGPAGGWPAGRAPPSRRQLTPGTRRGRSSDDSRGGRLSSAIAAAPLGAAAGAQLPRQRSTPIPAVQPKRRTRSASRQFA